MAMICFWLIPFPKAVMGSALKVFLQFDLSAICASVLFEYLLNLVMLHYMLLIMVYIVHHSVFDDGGAVVPD